MSLVGLKDIIPPGYMEFVSAKTTFDILEECPTMERFINQNPELRAEYEKFKTFEILNDKYGKR